MCWNYLAIFFAISLVLCLVGFYKYVYFLSIGYGFSVAGIGVAQTAPVFFRMYNGGEVSAVAWIGTAICVLGIVLESIADKQKSEQKKANPDMVATQGLYKIVRCPNYFGEILFWTGVFVSSLDILASFGQWLMSVIAYVCIVFIMFNGAQRLEKRQMARYGDDKAYNEYADKTPIIIPLLPIYHLNKK